MRGFRFPLPITYGFIFLRFTLFCDADDDAQASCMLGKSPTSRSSLNSLVILNLEIRAHEDEGAEAGSELTILLPQPAPQLA